MEFADFNENTLGVLTIIFEKVNLGVLVLNYPKKIPFFVNPYFRFLAKDNEAKIIDDIVQHVDLYSKIMPQRDIDIGVDAALGYSVYKISNDYFLVFINDISSKKLIHKAKESKQYYSNLSLLIAEVAHEIGNPLSSVLTTLEVLHKSQETWGIKKKQAYLERAISEIDRVSQHLGRLKKFSVQEKMIRKPVLLKKIIDKAVSNNQAMLEANQIEIQCEIDRNIVVHVDEAGLYQVLLNLLINSGDAVSQAGKISISSSKLDSYLVKLVYKNNGPRIPPRIRGKIFLPFFTTKKKGLGIGLAVSMKMMANMGGTIKLGEPEGEWGVVFNIYIPVQSA